MSYAIGVAAPLSVMVFSFGTSGLSESELLQVVNDNFDLRPGMIIKYVTDIFLEDSIIDKMFITGTCN